MQRRRVVGQLEQRSGRAEWRRASRNRSASATAATIRLVHCGHADTVAAIETVADREERRELVGVEADRLAVVVEHHEHRRGHGRNVALPLRASAPVGVASAECGH